MFEKLEYKLQEGETNAFLLYRDSKDRCSVRFNIKEKSVSIFYNPDEDVYSQEIVMSLELFKAINKQVEELGWNNENNRLISKDIK